jgi:CobQ-like glutamine amidotransferase family enzyme
MAGESAVRVALVFPELLGTYGDGGNARVLVQRLQWRDVPAEVVATPAGETVPDSCDIYLLGGGEDAPQARAAAELRSSNVLTRVVERGAPVFAVCGGYQILGHAFTGGADEERPGLGLLDVRTVRRAGVRAVGELVAQPTRIDTSDALPTLTGFENHGGATSLGAAAQPLGRVQHGYGNGTGDGTEGAVQGRIIGTYLHGPVLARNPALADLLLMWVVGRLEPIDDADVDRLRAERLAAAGASTNHTPRWWTSLRRGHI